MTVTPTALDTQRVSFTVKEAAALVGISAYNLQAEIRAGNLKAKRTGEKRGVYLISREALVEWFDQLKDA